jgi:hypothetical protein
MWHRSDLIAGPTRLLGLDRAELSLLSVAPRGERNPFDDPLDRFKGVPVNCAEGAVIAVGHLRVEKPKGLYATNWGE